MDCYLYTAVGLLTLGSRLYTYAVGKHQKGLSIGHFYYMMLFISDAITMQAGNSTECFVERSLTVELEDVGDYYTNPNHRDKIYILEYTHFSFKCVPTENYQGRGNISSITYTFDIKDNSSLVAATTRQNMEDYVMFTISNIHTEWLHMTHILSIICVTPGETIAACDVADHDRLNHIDIEVTRKPLPIEFLAPGCVVEHWRRMVCHWLPAFEGDDKITQKKHTQLLGSVEPISQMFSWQIVSSPTGNTTNVETFKWPDNQVVFSPPDVLWLELDGAVYNMSVKVQALSPEYEHASQAFLQVNTSQIVKTDPALELVLQLQEGTESSWANVAINYTWTLPSETCGRSLVSRLSYTCEWAHVEIDADSSGSCTGSIITNDNVDSAVLRQLLPYTHYDVTLQLSTPGSLLWSEPKNQSFFTPPQKPAKHPEYTSSMFAHDSTNSCPEPCVDLCGNGTSHTCKTATVYWKPLKPSEYGGRSLHYILEFSLPNKDIVTRELTANNSEVHVHFDWTNEINIRIVAQNFIGECEIKQNERIMLLDSEDGLKVTELEVRSDNGSSVNVTWQLASPNSAREEEYTYTLFWCKRFGNVVYQHCVSPVNFMRIPGRDVKENNGLYEVTIPTPTEDGSGLLEDWYPLQYQDMLFGVSVDASGEVQQRRSPREQMYRREATVPPSGGIVWAHRLFLATAESGPVILHVENSQLKESGSLLASWSSRCTDVCGIPEVYRVLCCLSPHECKEFLTPSQSFLITGLKEGQNYSVTIQVISLITGSWKSVSETVYQKACCVSIVGTFSKTAIVSIVVVASIILVFTICSVVFLCRYCRKKYRWYHTMPVEIPSRRWLPGENNRAPYNTQDSQDSAGPLLRQNSSQTYSNDENGKTVPRSPDIPEEEDDDVFRSDYIPTSGQGQGFISLRVESQEEDRRDEDCSTPPPAPHINNRPPPPSDKDVTIGDQYLTSVQEIDPYLKIVDRGRSPQNNNRTNVNPPCSNPNPWPFISNAREGSSDLVGAADTLELSMLSSRIPHNDPPMFVPLHRDLANEQTKLTGKLPTENTEMYSAVANQQQLVPRVSQLNPKDLRRAKAEPEENYFNAYKMTPSTSMDNTKLSPAKVKSLKEDSKGKFLSGPLLGGEKGSLSLEKSKGHSRDELQLLPSGYVSLDTSVDSERDNIMVKNTNKGVGGATSTELILAVHPPTTDNLSKPKRLELKRSSNEPMENAVYVQLPEKSDQENTSVSLDDCSLIKHNKKKDCPQLENQKDPFSVLDKVDIPNQVQYTPTLTVFTALDGSQKTENNTGNLVPSSEENQKQKSTLATESNDKKAMDESGDLGYCPTSVTFSDGVTEMPSIPNGGVYDRGSNKVSDNLYHDGDCTLRDEDGEVMPPDLGEDGLIVEYPTNINVESSIGNGDLVRNGSSTTDFDYYRPTALRMDCGHELNSNMGNIGSDDSGKSGSYCPTRILRNERASEIMS